MYILVSTLSNLLLPYLGLHILDFSGLSYEVKLALIWIAYGCLNLPEVVPGAIS